MTRLGLWVAEHGSPVALALGFRVGFRAARGQVASKTYSRTCSAAAAAATLLVVVSGLNLVQI